MALRALARGLIVLAAAWSPVAPAAALPQIDSFPSAAPLVVRYDLFFNGIFAAEVTETLSTDGAGAYRIESEARARGLAKILIGDILRKSEGLWEGESLRPLLYEEIRGKNAIIAPSSTARARRSNSPAKRPAAPKPRRCRPRR